MTGYGPTMQPCGRAHFVCEDCVKVRLHRILDNANKEPVVVVPLTDWRRLVEYCLSWMQAHHCEGQCDVCDGDDQIRSILAKVEVQHD